MFFSEIPNAFFSPSFLAAFPLFILHESDNVTFMWILRFDENQNQIKFW